MSENDLKPPTPKQHYLLQFFNHEHLPEQLQPISKPLCDIAKWLEMVLPDNPERTTALRKLLEAKDCAVRALIFED
jgi:ferritin-like protein